MPRGGGDDYGTPQIAVRPLTPVVKWMLVVLAVFFLIGIIDEQYVTHGKLYQLGALLPNRVIKDHAGFHFELWRLVTYPLVNPFGESITPVLWGAASLYFFGCDLEDDLGQRRFILFTALCVLLPGIVATAYGAIHPVFFTQPVFSISAISFAMTAAWGTRYPNRRLFFPPVSGKWLVIGLLVIQLIYVLARAARENPAASIGAMGIGFLLIRYWDRIDDVLDRMRVRRARKKRDNVLRAIRGGLDDRGSGKKKPVDKRFLN
jgi:membrane associated rhomboid family serine protease